MIVMGAAQRQLQELPLSVKSMKARQCSKIAELRWALEQSGHHSLDKQASALGLGRSTTWAILQASHKGSGVSGSVIKRMLRSPTLPPAAKKWIAEYVSEKLSGAYGHSIKRLRIFRAQVAPAIEGQIAALRDTAELLRAQLDDVRKDRDHWGDQAKSP